MQSVLPSYSSLEHSNPAHGEYVVINWCLGNTCNYACSYCPEGLHNASTKWPSSETVIQFIDRALAHYKGKKLYFEFTGGEVTLWKDLVPVATYLRSVGCKIGIISNGSRSLDFFARIVESIDHICLSFHPESADKEHFHSVVEYCAERVRTHVNFMMEITHFDSTIEFSKRVKDIPNISVAVQPLVKDLVGEIYPYSDAQLQMMNTQHEYLVKHIKYTRSLEYYRGAMAMVDDGGRKTVMAPHRFISSDNNSWQGWECYVGLEQIVIDMKGVVYRGWCKVGGTIGRIDDVNLALPSKPILCNKERCHCNLDIMTTKKKRLHV